MDFVAIDFETATSCWTSICSMGICVVEDNKIVERKELLVKPAPFEFNKYNVRIHGITADMVQDMPTFDVYWSSIKPYLQNKLVIAHNTSFDINVLRTTLDYYGIAYPSFDYLCTVKLSQKAYPDFPSHKLNVLCDMLGVNFLHHHAAEDAYACAKVMLRILKDFNLRDTQEIEEKFGVSTGCIYPGVHLREPKHKEKVYPKTLLA